MKAKNAHSFIAREITHPDAIAFLTHPTKHRLLQPFMHQACLIKDAAQHVGFTPNQMYRQVQKMLELGLLHVVERQARKGRKLLYYRSVADSLTIPLSQVALDQVLELGYTHIGQQMATYVAQKVLDIPSSVAQGVVHVTSYNGQMVFQLKLSPTNQELEQLGILSIGGNLKLSRSSHQKLLLELQQVFVRYAQLQEKSETESLLFIGLTPM